MKVLFAVNNDNVSSAIIKKYQKNYKEIITYKNVYYFNAILKELQNDKTYDRVVISEDLEPFANNNYDTIDKFLFEKLDRISDEATKVNGDNIDIILICSDRRKKADEMLTKIFGIGIYNALIEDDRNIDMLCKLLNQPRTKKEAKIDYKITGSNVGYQAEDENNVSEAEVQNILAHYKRLGKDEDRYVDSFNNIVSQYTDAQLRIIIRYLPLNVKAVLEERSPKYQELAALSEKTNGRVSKTPYIPRVAKDTKKEEKINIKMLQNEKDKISRPIVIPSALTSKKKILTKPKESEDTKMTKVVPSLSEQAEQTINEMEIEKNEEINTEIINEEPKRGRGRPKKITSESKKEDEEEDVFDFISPDSNSNDKEIQPEKKQEKNDEEFDLFSLDDTNNTMQQEENETDDLDLLNIEENDENLNDEAEQKNETDDSDLFSISENDSEIENKKNNEEEEETDLFSLGDEENTLEDNNEYEDNELENEVDLFNIEDD